MPWPFSYDVKPSELRTVLEQVQGKATSYAREAFFSKAVFPGRIAEVLRQIRSSVNAGVKSGDQKIGYLSQLNDMRTALRRLDVITARGAGGVDARVAGEAFGELFTASSAFMDYAPAPFNAYAEPMRQWGKAFAGVADMMTGNTKYYQSGYSRHQVRNLLDNAASKTTGDL